MSEILSNTRLGGTDLRSINLTQVIVTGGPMAGAEYLVDAILPD